MYNEVKLRNAQPQTCHKTTSYPLTLQDSVLKPTSLYQHTILHMCSVEQTVYYVYDCVLPHWTVGI